MSRIIHLALKVEDLEKTTEFYEKVFNFKQVGDETKRGHTSRHLSDGTIDLALVKYETEESSESMASGEGPCIHHFGVEVDDISGQMEEAKKFGVEIISDPGVFPIKFRAPGGTVMEMVPKGRYKKPAE